MAPPDSDKPESTADLTNQDQQQEPQSAERKSFLELTRQLAGLPLDQAAAALETSAAIASISLRAGVEFLRAVPGAAQILQASELKSWGELGRRLAMGDYEAAAAFFAEGVEKFQDVPRSLHADIFQLCVRQMTLSTTVGKETFQAIPSLVADVNDEVLFKSIVGIATEIARRSAKHSAEFLKSSGDVCRAVVQVDNEQVTEKTLLLAGAFAARAGGIAADAWAALPEAVADLSSADAIRLVDRSTEFLERGGGAALHILLSGGELLRRAPEIFDDWIDLLWVVAKHGNASLVAFVRSSPRFIRLLGGETNRDEAVLLARRVLSLTTEIAEIDGEAALACFRSSGRALQNVSIEQFEAWAKRGLSAVRPDTRARRSYFSLETRGSYEALHSGMAGLSLDAVQHLLRLYVEALPGREVDIIPLAAVPDESRIGDGRTIHLPSLVNEFGDDDLDFRLYKVLAAHGAGQIEFGTYDHGGSLAAAYRAISDAYDPKNLNALDAFALGDEMVDPLNQETTQTTLPSETIGYQQILRLFPMPQLARRVFGTLENGRIDNHRGG